MKVLQVVPEERELGLDDLIEKLERDCAGLRPFDEAAIAVCRDLSRALLEDSEASGYPDLQALAFWMRPSEVEQLRQHHERLRAPGIRVMPRGLAFHLPPSNVDTLFVYVWLLALLAGNRSVVRLSQRAARQAEIICSLLNRVLEQQPDERVRNATTVLRYGHDEEVSERISAHADVRIVWGGDETVRKIRAIPLPPHALELTFPDRFSMAALDAEAVLGLDEGELLHLVERFFSDAYWFDQMACGSPRMVLWCGTSTSCVEASRVFFEALRGVVTQRGYRVGVSVALDKKVFLDRAVLDHPVRSCSELGNELAVVTLESVSDVRGEFCGGGVFFQVGLAELGEIATHVRRMDQTLTHFGFDEAELEGLVEALGGRGIDRLVPIGRGLSFATHWDGFDLMASLSRCVVLE